jgi:hypothetical protein
MNQQQSREALVFWVKPEGSLAGRFDLNWAGKKIADVLIQIEIGDKIDSAVAFRLGDFQAGLQKLAHQPVASGKFDELRIVFLHLNKTMHQLGNLTREVELLADVVPIRSYP